MKNQNLFFQKTPKQLAATAMIAMVEKLRFFELRPVGHACLDHKLAIPALTPILLKPLY